MELRHLRYFIAVAEEHSFLKAAERLHISQPPLSTQIKDLESELGVTLLSRSPRGITLTEPGKVFYAEARAILARVEHAKVAAQRAARGEQGRLRIGFISVVDYSFLPPALKEFRTRFPQVEVQLHELTSDAQAKELLHDTLDVGIALAPVDDEALAFSSLCAEPLMLALAADHPLAQTSGAGLERFSSEPFVMVPRAAAPGYYDTFTSYCREHGFSPRITQTARQMQTVISLVANNFGVAIVPAALRNLQRTGVVYLPLVGKGATIEIGMVARKSDTNPAIDSFRQVLTETIGHLGRSAGAAAAPSLQAA